jgi:hypothetical protein
MTDKKLFAEMILNRCHVIDELTGSINAYCGEEKLAKECPNFHLEFTALTLLNTYRHHGPALRKEVTIPTEAYELLDAVEKYVKEQGCI